MEMTCEVFILLNDIATEGYECGRLGEYDERLEMVVCGNTKKSLSISTLPALPRILQHHPAANLEGLLKSKRRHLPKQWERFWEVPAARYRAKLFSAARSVSRKREPQKLSFYSVIT